MKMDVFCADIVVLLDTDTRILRSALEVKKFCHCLCRAFKVSYNRSHLCHYRGYKSYVFSWYEDMGVEAVLTEDDETIVDNDCEHTSNI